MEEEPKIPQISQEETPECEDDTFDLTVYLYGMTDEEWESIRYAIKEQGIGYKTS